MKSRLQNPNGNVPSPKAKVFFAARARGKRAIHIASCEGFAIPARTSPWRFGLCSSAFALRN